MRMTMTTLGAVLGLSLTMAAAPVAFAGEPDTMESQPAPHQSQNSFRQGGQTIGHDAHSAAKAVGHGTHEVLTTVGHGARDTTKAIGHGTRDFFHGIGHGLKDGWHEVTE